MTRPLEVRAMGIDASGATPQGSFLPTQRTRILTRIVPRTLWASPRSRDPGIQVSSLGLNQTLTD